MEDVLTNLAAAAEKLIASKAALSAIENPLEVENFSQAKELLVEIANYGQKIYSYISAVENLKGQSLE